MGCKDKIMNIINIPSLDKKHYKQVLKSLDLKEEHINNKDLSELLDELYNIKEQMDGMYKVNLKPAQINLIKAKKKLNEYNHEVIMKLESWLSKVNSFSNYSSFAGESGLNIENAISAENLYSEYLQDQRYYFETEKEVTFYTNSHTELKSKESHIINKLLSHYAKVISDTIDTYFYDTGLPTEEVFDYCFQKLKYLLSQNRIPRQTPDLIDKKIRIDIKSYCNAKISTYKEYKLNEKEELNTNMKEPIIRKLINMIKTEMSPSKIKEFLNMNKLTCNEDTIKDYLKELDTILKIYNDTNNKQANKDIELVVKTHDISVDLALYILKNKESIKESLTKYLTKYNIN